MNTPAHAVVNLLVLGRREKPGLAFPIVLGSVLPDLPIMVFYAWAKGSGLPEGEIWSRAYFAPAWQAAIDLWHSLPLILVALLLAWRLGSERGMALFAGMALHVPEDLFLHNEDAHRHFYPFSDWRFRSPVSYWDPRHHGAIAGPLEALLVLVAATLLLRRFPSPWVRGLLLVIMASYVLFWGFVLREWVF